MRITHIYKRGRNSELIELFQFLRFVRRSNETFTSKPFSFIFTAFNISSIFALKIINVYIIDFDMLFNVFF